MKIEYLHHRRNVDVDSILFLNFIFIYVCDFDVYIFIKGNDAICISKNPHQILVRYFIAHKKTFILCRIGDRGNARDGDWEHEPVAYKMNKSIWEYYRCFWKNGCEMIKCHRGQIQMDTAHKYIYILHNFDFKLQHNKKFWIFAHR